MLLQRAEFRAGAVNTAREYGSKDKHFAWTRRLIALGAVGAIIVLPKVAAIFYPEVGVVVGYTEVDGGILSWLLGGHEAVVRTGDNPRRASFLARMGGMRGPEKDSKGKPTRLLLSLRAWGASSKADAKSKAAAISKRNKKNA